MKKTVTFFEDILKILGIIYIILTLIGFLDLKTYYSRFGIAINEYLSVSEIVLLSFDKIFLVLFVLVIQIIIWLSLFDFLFNYDIQELMADGKRRPKENDFTIEQFLKSKKIRLMGFVILIGLIISAIFRNIYPQTRFWRISSDFFALNLWIAMILYMGMLQGTKTIWDNFKKSREYNIKAVIILSISIIVFAASVWVKNGLLYSRIYKHGNMNNITIFLKEGSKISPTDTIRYLGKTGDYYFFWNRYSKTAFIYPKGEIYKVIIE